MTEPARSTPVIDVVIAVHTPTRPIERAVASVLEGTGADVRAIVVIHNTEREPVEARLAAYAADPRLRVEHLVDGIPSPAGPMNHGFDVAEGEFIALLGSDDVFDPGALDAWLALARRDCAEIVLAPIRSESGAVVPTPPVRIGRRRGLGLAADRLLYRSAPLGLISRRVLGGTRFPEGIATGEDQPFVAELWSSGSMISFDPALPGYRILEDQSDRVTRAPRAVRDEFAVLERLLDPGARWMRDAEQRLALSVKTVRVHVLDAVGSRLPDAWDAEAHEQLGEVARRICAAEPRLVRCLSRSEHALLEGVLDPATPADRLGALDRARRTLRSPASLFPRGLRYSLHPQGALRWRIAGSMVVRTGRKGPTR